MRVLADYSCHWSASKNAAHCDQRGQPSPSVRHILMRELHRLGLPQEAKGGTYFLVWKSAHSGWSVAMAHYSRTIGSDLELCETIMIIGEGPHAIVLRTVPFQKTDVDVPAVTLWTPVDIADVERDGGEDVVLRADSYENHWLEVVSVRGGTAKTIFSGLGYYL